VATVKISRKCKGCGDTLTGWSAEADTEWDARSTAEELWEQEARQLGWKFVRAQYYAPETVLCGRCK
jgi:hypothetical protein